MLIRLCMTCICLWYAVLRQGGSHIFWNDKKGKCGGHLDVDMNASKKNLVDTPIENIFWDKPPPGDTAVECKRRIHEFLSIYCSAADVVLCILSTNRALQDLGRKQYLSQRWPDAF